LVVSVIVLQLNVVGTLALYCITSKCCWYTCSILYYK